MTQLRSKLSWKRCTTAGAVLASAASLCAPTASAQSQAAAAGDGPNYVALGDSYASGAGLTGRTDAECDRTSNSYPSVLSKTSAGKNRTFKDVTCSGATTRSIWNYQGSKPPQANALTRNTKLVTLTLGGNDVGFTEVLGTCVRLALTRPSENSPCKAYYTAGGKDVLGERINTMEGRIRGVLTDIRRRSPDAKVIVVGYPSVFPDSGIGCKEVPFAQGDFAFLRDMTKKLNRALERRAKAGDRAVRYADTYTPTIGHDMCAPGDRRMIESLNPSPNTLAAHPNWVGQFVMATAAYAEIVKP
ncbi:SGNH/GDSL hydrolase family protein [Streptomyces sp. NPDC019531]|uniref:SGNH/GDSL hydrolase family protein n=1 Tax=Streptomyces sp. NPDC019531 TaxID=3365062 RepID=UPI00384F008B